MNKTCETCKGFQLGYPDPSWGWGQCRAKLPEVNDRRWAEVHKAEWCLHWQAKEREIAARDDHAEFDLFWKAYPRKIGKAAARKAYRNAKNKPNINELVLAVARCAASEQWSKDGGQFIPHPATWLNRGGWDDEPMQKQETAIDSFMRRHGHGAASDANRAISQGVDALDLPALGQMVQDRPARGEGAD